MFIDTHCHIDDSVFNNKAELITELNRAGIDKVINMGCNVLSSNNSLGLAEQFDMVYFAAGFHPEYANELTDKGLDEIARFSEHKKCVAIGEIGLDYHYSGFDKDKMIDAFIKQLDLAFEKRLPVSIHCRDATKDVLDILCSRKNKLDYSGVMHCYSGSKETAKIILDAGLYISFSGTLTFKNASNLREVASFVPLDRCLTETDSPYLSPEPFRGKLNNPANVAIVTDCLSNIKGLNLEQTANKLMQNAKSLFKKIV